MNLAESGPRSGVSSTGTNSKGSIHSSCVHRACVQAKAESGAAAVQWTLRGRVLAAPRTRSVRKWNETKSWAKWRARLDAVKLALLWVLEVHEGGVVVRRVGGDLCVCAKHFAEVVDSPNARWRASEKEGEAEGEVEERRRRRA
eukprot:715017-Pleurochrysis_carterae.AAC.1